jgi:hypothetical protein
MVWWRLFKLLSEILMQRDNKELSNEHNKGLDFWSLHGLSVHQKCEPGDLARHIPLNSLPKSSTQSF